jgi:hypothetical protein
MFPELEEEIIMTSRLAYGLHHILADHLNLARVNYLDRSSFQANDAAVKSRIPDRLHLGPCPKHQL